MGGPRPKPAPHPTAGIQFPAQGVPAPIDVFEKAPAFSFGAGTKDPDLARAQARKRKLAEAAAHKKPVGYAGVGVSAATHRVEPAFRYAGLEECSARVVLGQC